MLGADMSLSAEYYVVATKDRKHHAISQSLAIAVDMIQQQVGDTAVPVAFDQAHVEVSVPERGDGSEADLAGEICDCCDADQRLQVMVAEVERNWRKIVDSVAGE